MGCKACQKSINSRSSSRCSVGSLIGISRGNLRTSLTFGNVNNNLLIIPQQQRNVMPKSTLYKLRIGK